jgi:acyl carrier protein
LDVAKLREQEVLDLMVERIRAVMALPGAGLPRGARATGWRDVRFDEDLHADSLDLVEVVEGVERELRHRGHEVSVADADLAYVRAVGDAVDAFLHRAGRR